MSEPARLTVDYAPGLERAFDLVPEEAAYPVAGIEGEVPAYLRGSYYLIGPARFHRGGLAYRHWLDGDGMVATLRFGDGGVSFASRFVASDKLREEEEAGRPLYRTFGTAFDGDRLLRGVALASPVNVSVYPFAGTLLAFGEQGLPWELDPLTLETRGEHTFGRRLNPVSPFAAHPKFDRGDGEPHSGEMFNFGVSFATAQPTLTLYRFDAGGGLVFRRRHPLPYPCSLHDFGLSGRWAVFYVAPYVMDVGAFLDGGASVMESLSWQPERGSRLVVLDRETGELAAEVPIGDGYCLHHINAFDDGDRLVVDVMELDEPVYKDYQPLPELFVEVGESRPVRRVVDVAAGRLVGERAMDYRLASDFPAIDLDLSGRPYRHFWMLSISATGKPGRKFLDRLVAGDWQEGRITDQYGAPEGRYFAGEPVFVPDPEDPDGGTVIVPELDAQAMATSFLLFAAGDLGRGPTARLPLRSPLHLGFHTTFHPAAGA